MKQLISKLKKGTILEEWQMVAGTVLRTGVTCAPGSGASHLHFILKEYPDKAYMVQNWATGNAHILFTKPGDRVSFKWREGMDKIDTQTFRNESFRLELGEIQGSEHGSMKQA